MLFSNFLKNDKSDKQITETKIIPVVKHEILQEKAQTPEQILRSADFKIKLITPTSFGTQIDFAKKYNDSEIKDLLKDFNIKIKDKSVFIVD
jgi:hypothetical protein